MDEPDPAEDPVDKPPASVEEDPRRSRAFLDSIVENIPNMVFVKDANELRFVRFNRAGEELIGYSRDDMVGKNDYDLFPQSEADFFTRKDREVLAGRNVVDIPAEPIDTRFHGQRILHTQKIPILGDDGQAEFLLGISEDITERVMAEEALRERQETLSAVFEASPDAIMILTPDLAIREVSAAIEHIDAVPVAERTAIGWLESIHPEDAGDVTEALTSLVGPQAQTVEVRYRTLHAAGHWVPVEARGRTLRDRDGNPSGAVVVVRDISERLLAASELVAERQTVDMLQRAFLPKLPAFDHVEVAGTYRPAGTDAVVGGDWYDAFEIAPGRIGICVGDVVARGLEAATTMGQLRSALRALAAAELGPADVLSRLDAFAEQVPRGRMATVAYAELELASGRMRYACGGHPPPVIVDPEGHAELLEGGRSAPLGAARGPRPDAEVALAPGTRLVFYTDGLVERRNRSLERGLALLVEEAGRRRVDSAARLADGILEALLPGETQDDVCLLVIGFGAGTRFDRELGAHPEVLAPLRDDLRAWLSGNAVLGHDRDALVFAASEAVTNAIEHAYRDIAAGLVWVSARMGDDGVLLRVTDHGSWRQPGEVEDRGRGLLLLDKLMDGVEVDHAEGTTVTMRKHVTGRT